MEGATGCHRNLKLTAWCYHYSWALRNERRKRFPGPQGRELYKAWGLGLWDKATSKGLCREGNKRINILTSLFSSFPNFLLTG